ncbi:alpha/beta hydrolase [Paenibacillus sp. UMB4589-SE434]|uniref:alpha/beta hydrolase family protein n=1 Tax=Paenibacillus sp. UMB4589-SE434 TaxID=3046314 RepID=UPI00254F5828|nr:alpha/beta hydrolase [Paenibacillus sp. UMB4589-SE434]MDK8180329.1 alpha/beta hydrolase [Paenibacillus sp. UMB4589-SE434]
MKHKVTISILIIFLLVGGAGLYIMMQNSFNMVEQAVEIQTPQGKLTGTLVLPKNYTSKLGLVLFIHGDGPIDASHDDGYKPLWERLASLGYASLSLNKRGINGSEGNWEHQNIQDRVEEARQAIAWAKEQPMIDEKQIGVWGASQAGWVIPRLAKQETLAFSLLLSPAINWISQGQYNTRSEMLAEGKSEAEIQDKLAYNQQVRQLLEKHASYEEYVKIARENSLMSRDRWIFAGKNLLSDATDDLRNFNSPVLLMLGEEDINVDVKDTERVYRNVVKPELLRVAVFPDADHSMLAKQTANSNLRAILISLFAPRQITIPGYMDEIEQFLRKLPE